MLNISWSNNSKDSIFGIHMDILIHFWLRGKNLQLEPLGKNYSILIEKLALKIMSSNFLKSMFEFTQTTKSCNRRMKHKFQSLDNLRSIPEMIYSYSKHNFCGGIFFCLEGQWCYLKPINGRIDKKWLLFIKSVSYSRILRTNSIVCFKDWNYNQRHDGSVQSLYSCRWIVLQGELLETQDHEV